MFWRIEFLLLISLAGIAADALRADERIDFAADVQPLLIEKCGQCHSATTQKSELDLSSIAALRRGGESQEPLIGATPDESLLWQRIDGGGMPPEDEPQLTLPQRDLLRRWIATSGASFRMLAAHEQPLDQHDVIPILLLRCTTCHGPQRRDGELDLRTPEAAVAGGGSGPGLVPGDPDASLIIRRIESQQCPPSELLLKFFVRRPPKAEVAILREWIAQGAPQTSPPPAAATLEADPLVHDRDRQHWAFQPPMVSRGESSIDDFIRAKLLEHGLDLSPEADRASLIRRAYFDLIGLPPSVKEWQTWQTSADPNWYEQMIEALLASPHYGQRWGRYWLDLAGYADSEGGISADPLRPVAWKYRDYVIDAFNKDTPYDRFLLQQLAGDELIDCERAEVVTDEMVENLIATGFLRMGIDETGSRTMNFVPERLQVISDAITVVSGGLMGLTMHCARCHSHKYDPIPHRDYYRFKAIFQGALDEHDWRSFKTRTLNIATDEQRRLVERTNPALQAEIKKLVARQKQLTEDVQLALLRHHYPQQSEADHRATLSALRVADNNRTLPQKMLVERLQAAEFAADAMQPETVLEGRLELERIEGQIDRLRRQMAPELTIRALWDAGRPSPTYVLRRGEYDKPGEWVGPGVPSVLTDGKTPFEVTLPFPGGTPKTGRRLAFARWLTRPDHPLTARVMVNRIWFHHFGTGLVADLENFGVQGEPPTHPELLDWLAVEFVRHGWSVKAMHRLIMHSQTYRQSSRVTSEAAQRDPDNRWLSRMNMRRLDAEALRDCLLDIAGKLEHTAGGLPDAVRVDRDGLVSVVPTASGRWRRSVYLQYRRTQIPTLMDTFDYPQMGPNCVSRSVSIVSPQSLMLMNNGHIRELATAFADRIELLKDPDKPSGEESIAWAYRLAISREPTQQERRLALAAWPELVAAWQGDERSALESYCHALLNSAAFLYVD